MSSDRPVNTLLNALRGEHYRRAQNSNGTRTSRSAGSYTHNKATLPPFHAPQQQRAPQSRFTITRGHDPVVPVEPPSKTSARRDALALTLAHIVKGASSDLVKMCLDILLSSYEDVVLLRDVFPHLPSHVRRDIIRRTAQTSPLPTELLYGLLQPHGHADGEIIVVTPQDAPQSHQFQAASVETNAEADWDEDEAEIIPPLKTLVIFNINLSPASFTSLPPMLTTLTLIGLPHQIPLHRLPGQCPLLEFLDLSYNEWLIQKCLDDPTTLELVPWEKWGRLLVLGIRGCRVTNAVRDKINPRGRWTRTEIVE